MNGIPPGEEENPASPITLEAQIEQIEADNALAEQLQADEQIVADNALARQLQAPHSITVPRLWPENGQIPESANTPGETEEQIPKDDPRHPRRSPDSDNSSDICYDWSFSSAFRSP